jgi:nitroreductase
MDLFDAIYTRRSIRRYSDQPIEKEKVDKILRAAMYAPSAVNKQPWHFIVFKNTASRQKIMEVNKNSAMLAESQTAILICFDENLQHGDGYGVIDCSSATQNMLLASHALGLGACWVGIYPRIDRIEALIKIFNLPENIVPFAVIALGYPFEKKETPQRFKQDRIHYETW